ncbi:hypothetical protein DRH14_04705, partial [Candidatus Shapirobacteria bacterium]
TGANVSQTMPSEFYFRFRPYRGLPISDSATGFYGELHATYTRLRVRTYTYDGKAAPYTDVSLVGYDVQYYTDATGKIDLDVPSGTLTVKSLGGSAEKTVTLEPFTLNEVDFYYAGIEVTLNVAGVYVVGAMVKIGDYVTFTEVDGVARFYMAKVNTQYTIESYGLTKDVRTGDERTLIMAELTSDEASVVSLRLYDSFDYSPINGLIGTFGGWKSRSVGGKMDVIVLGTGKKQINIDGVRRYCDKVVEVEVAAPQSVQTGVEYLDRKTHMLRAI